MACKQYSYEDFGFVRGDDWAPLRGVGEGVCCSVTTILGTIAKPWLVKWAAGLERANAAAEAPPAAYYYELVRDEAAEAGTAAHEAIAAALSGESSGDGSKAVSDALAIVDQLGIKVVDVERVVPVGNRSGGTIDVVGESDGVRVVLDWKTGRTGSVDHMAQVAAYARAEAASYAVLAAVGDKHPKGGRVMVLDEEEIQRLYREVFKPAEKLHYATIHGDARRMAVPGRIIR